MLIVMLFLLGCYIFLAFFLAKNFLERYETQATRRVQEMQKSYEDLAHKREAVAQERSLLEKDLMQILTLYEMTKEITKKLKEEDAFEIFTAKLKEHAHFEECRLVTGTSAEHEQLQSSAQQFVFPLKSKREKFGSLVIKGLHHEDVNKVIILGHQFALILRRVKLHQEVEELAITDSLTGVHTRRYFLSRFEEELGRSAARKIDLAFLMVDVDYFKNINDKFGHLVGDQVLREVGRIIKENIREIDIVGRFGGEEFCVVLPVTDLDGAQFASERIRSAVEESVINAYDASVKITVSIGVATFPHDGKTTAELIDKSDWALYRAKKKGRNCICAFGIYDE